MEAELHVLQLVYLDTSNFLKRKIDQLILAVNENLNHWEQIQKYQLIFDPISIETGELTPSMKLRRSFIEEKYRHVIEEFYVERAFQE